MDIIGTTLFLSTHVEEGEELLYFVYTKENAKAHGGHARMSSTLALAIPTRTCQLATVGHKTLVAYYAGGSFGGNRQNTSLVALNHHYH